MEFKLRYADEKDLKWLSNMRIKLAKLEAKRAGIEIDNFSFIGLDEIGTLRVLPSCEIIEVEGNKVGYFRSVKDDLCEIYIDPKFRRKGIGAAILKILAGRLSKICVIVRKTNQHGVKFYKDNGFDYVEDWGSVLFMKKECDTVIINHVSGDRSIIPCSDFANSTTARLDRVSYVTSRTENYKICEIYNGADRLVGKVVVVDKDIEKQVKDIFSRKLGLDLDIKDMGFVINGEKYRLTTWHKSKFCMDWLDKDYFVFNSPEKTYINTNGTKLTESKIPEFYSEYEFVEDEYGNILVVKSTDDKVVKFADILRLVK